MKFTAFTVVLIIIILTLFNLYIFIGDSNILFSERQEMPMRNSQGVTLDGNRKDMDEVLAKRIEELQGQLESGHIQYDKMKEVLEEVLVPFAAKLGSLESQVAKDINYQQTQLQQIKQLQAQLQLAQENKKETEVQQSTKASLIDCSQFEASTTHKGELNWEEEMAKLDWQVVEEAVKSRTHTLPDEWVSKYLETVIPFLEEVKGPLINTTHPLLEVDCTKDEYSHFLTGKRREKAVRVFDLTEMAYELDILEIRLFELEEVVDEFVILEGLYTHIGVKKPLFYERNYQRFSRWKDKIKYMVWDERMSIDSHRLNGIIDAVDWSLEKKSRQVLMNAFIELHRGGADLNDEDIFILGDLDEVPHRDPIAHLKYCEVKEKFLPARFDATFWRFSFHWLFNEIVKYPSVVSWKNVNTDHVSLREVHTNSIGDQAWHLNRFGPAIMQVVKEFSIAEGNLQLPSNNPKVLRDITYVEDLMNRGIRPCCPKDKLIHYESPLHQGVNIPWIILENKDSARWNFL